MKKLVLLCMIAALATISCSKSKPDTPDNPRTEVPAAIQGNWMNGNFSMTEYWNQYPGDYIGNGVEVAFAFTFNADGTFTQYFTAGVVSGGVQTFHQSVSKGTVEVDPVTKEIRTHAATVHYRRTVDRQVVEDRNLSSSEYDPDDLYNYTTGQDADGRDALYLTLYGTAEPRTFKRL